MIKPRDDFGEAHFWYWTPETVEDIDFGITWLQDAMEGVAPNFGQKVERLKQHRALLESDPSIRKMFMEILCNQTISEPTHEQDQQVRA